MESFQIRPGHSLSPAELIQQMEGKMTAVDEVLAEIQRSSEASASYPRPGQNTPFLPHSADTGFVSMPSSASIQPTCTQQWRKGYIARTVIWSGQCWTEYDGTGKDDALC